MQQEAEHDMEDIWLLSFENDTHIAAVLRDTLENLDCVDRKRATNRPDANGYYSAPNSCRPPLERSQSLHCCLETENAST